MTLYKLTNTMTQMSYIGATTRALNLRMNDHRKQAREGLPHPLAQAIRAYGWAAFTVTVIGTFATVAELHAAEHATILALGTLTPAGYNRASGGPGTPDCQHSDQTRQKISERAIGRAGHPAWNKGIPTAPETIAKRSAALRGRPTWNKGIRATDEHRAALRASHAGKANPASRPVEVNGQTFPTILAAAQGLGLSRMQVRYKLMTGRARYL